MTENTQKFKREDDPDLAQGAQFINYLVDAYDQTGDLIYRDALIDEFEGYFVKYVSIMSHGPTYINLENKDTKNFLRLFMTQEERRTEKTYRKAGAKKIHKIRRSLRLFTRDDLYNEVIVHFLELLENYKPIVFKRAGKNTRISFAHYIQVNIRYRLCRWIVKKSKDILTGTDCVEYIDKYHENRDTIKNDPPGVGIGINLSGWVWGKEAGEIFSELSEAERYLIWLRYEGNPCGKEMPMTEIANMTGLHYQTIIYRMGNIKKKLRLAMENFV